MYRASVHNGRISDKGSTARIFGPEQRQDTADSGYNTAAVAGKSEGVYAEPAVPERIE